MRLWRAVVAVSLALLTALVCGLAGASATAATAPPAPPGTLTGIAQLPAAQWPTGAAMGIRVTYTSTGVGGVPTTVTGRVFLPSFTAPAGGFPVLSYTHPTTGLGDSCAPSVNPLDPEEGTVLGDWLQQGYAVVATDYAGLGGPGVHPYLDGSVEAYGAIDIVRAMRRLAPGLFAARWAVAGLSQGGHAAMFTANLAAQYAPELDFRGAVAAAPPSGLTPIFSRLTPQTTILPGLTPLLAYILAGIEAANPSFDLNSYLSPLGTSLVTDAQTLCLDAMVARTQGIAMGQLLGKPLDSQFGQVMGPIFDVPTTGYPRPVFIAQSVTDEVVPEFLTNQLVSSLQAAGQPVTYQTYPSATHSQTELVSMPDAIAFLRPLLATP
ncbi:MAG TPA: lipase family protein [Pseudonocardiaceae bacterium]|jgi:acetyl esterase/lipase|nr:lipase family protein [Pseudonocardiaceae bacterium]